ncbi:MAG: undecaprenyl-diphosphate phosphatase [Coriobacteriia bacterium]
MVHVWAVILGTVQGVAEFLPISSSAHLTIIPWFFGIQNTYPMLDTIQFDIALHAGSFIAILVALWPDWVGLARGVVRGNRQDLRFAGFLLATSVPGAIAGALLEEKAQTVFRTPLLIAASLMIFGVLLWAVDKYSPQTGQVAAASLANEGDHHEPVDAMNWRTAILIGIAQAAAIIPGVSRAGATMTAGRAMKLSREATAKYSFMAAAPIILGGALFGLRHVPLAELFSTDWVLGFMAATVSSLLLMRWMLSYVRSHSFAIFMWYRIAVGLLIVVVWLLR